MAEAKQPTHTNEDEDFTSFFHDQYEKVVRFIMFCGGSVQEAEDAASQAFEKAYIGWATIKKPHAWIRTVAERAFLRERQRYRARLGPMPDVESIMPPCLISPDAVDAVDDHAWVEWVIKDLTPRQQQMMRGIVEGLSNEQIAQLLGTNSANVRSHVRHIRASLKQRLDLVSALLQHAQLHPKSQSLASQRKEGAK